jgi:hypothetical protein
MKAPLVLAGQDFSRIALFSLSLAFACVGRVLMANRYIASNTVTLRQILLRILPFPSLPILFAAAATVSFLSSLKMVSPAGLAADSRTLH